MNCPSCGNILQKLSVTTGAGGKFDVDHCGRCGGTWFDPYEINRIPYHEVTRLAKITVLPRLAQTNNKDHKYKCPRCRKDLVASHYDSVPKGVRMLRCPQCAGIWATQKALEEFKAHQEETIKEYKVGKTAFPALSVVFVPAVFTLLLFVITFSTVASLEQSKESRIKAESSVSALTTFPLSSSSESIAFRTKTPVSSSVAYGVDLLSMKTLTVSRQPSTNHHILLAGLKPQTLYIFTITLSDPSGRTFTTGENTFVTRGN